jgi:hypothetical protein
MSEETPACGRRFFQGKRPLGICSQGPFSRETFCVRDGQNRWAITWTNRNGLVPTLADSFPVECHFQSKHPE